MDFAIKHIICQQNFSDLHKLLVNEVLRNQLKWLLESRKL